MADEIYDDYATSDEGFNAWWPAMRAEFFLEDTEAETEAKLLASAAYRKGWEGHGMYKAEQHAWDELRADTHAAIANVQKLLADDEEPKPKPSNPWADSAADLDAALELAIKHNLTIETAWASGGWVQASRGAKLIVAETRTMHDMVEMLKAMEERGSL